MRDSKQRISAGRHPIRIGLVVLVWLAASGSLWDAVQVVAWGRMWVLNLESRTAVEALAETFSEDAICGLCKTVQAAKEAPREDGPVVIEASGKVPLIPFGSIRKLVNPPPRRGESHARVGGNEPLQRVIEPLLPPPRIG